MWKFEIPREDDFELEMPDGSIPLSVGVQHEKAVIWAAVNSETEKKEKHLFHLRGTGHPLPNLNIVQFVGTFQLRGGDQIFHLFDGGPVRE
jgi:hypothetical protein